MSTTLKLVETKQFGGIAFNCYLEESYDGSAGIEAEFWATREQIGQLLEYADPDNAITNIHRRNKDRLDKFSTGVKLTQVEGDRRVTREVVVYNFKGLLEICRYSNQPKADAVMDFLWEIADEIRRTGRYESKKTAGEDMKRAQSRHTHVCFNTALNTVVDLLKPVLTDALQNAVNLSTDDLLTALRAEYPEKDEEKGSSQFPLVESFGVLLLTELKGRADEMAGETLLNALKRLVLIQGLENQAQALCVASLKVVQNSEMVGSLLGGKLQHTLTIDELATRLSTHTDSTRMISADNLRLWMYSSGYIARVCCGWYLPSDSSEDLLAFRINTEYSRRDPRFVQLLVTSKGVDYFTQKFLNGHMDDFVVNGFIDGSRLYKC